jgi:CRP/FNR family cyclic AMP-dependent transcriptional regulator
MRGPESVGIRSDGATFAHGGVPLAHLAARGTRRKYRKGTLLIQEGDPGDTLFVLLSGRVKVYSIDASNREITFAVLGPGSYFGEMSLDGGPRSASVIVTEVSECSVLTLRSLKAFLAEWPEFAFDLLTTVIRRAREATAIARGLALESVYGRLAAYLNRIAVAGDGGTRQLPERITHLELASRVGSSREMVSRLLKDLEAGGYVETRNRRLVIKRALPARW